MSYFRRSPKLFFVFFSPKRDILVNFQLLRPISPEMFVAPVYFSRTIFGNSLGYFLVDKFSHCRVISKNNLEINDSSLSFCQIFLFERLFPGFIGGTGILLMYNYPQGSKLSFSLKHFSSFFLLKLHSCSVNKTKSVKNCSFPYYFCQ